MAVRNLALLGSALLACVLVGSGGYPQSPPELSPQVPGIPAPQPGGLIPSAIPSPSQPAPQTVDQLIDYLTELRRQKAELEKQEKAVTGELRKRLKEQKDRLTKLGIEPVEPPQPAVSIAPIGIPVVPSPR